MSSSEIVVGPGYLDALETIPEDGSMAATGIQHAVPQSVTNLSTVSAVASSESDRDGGIEVVDTSTQRTDAAVATTTKKGTRRSKRPRNSSGTGAAIGGGDAFSDTHASLGGAAEQQERSSPPSEEALKQKQASSPSASCTRRKMSFYVIVTVLLVAIAIGIYLIATKFSGGNSSSSDAAMSESQPTQDPIFPPYSFEGESFFPSISPTFNQEDVNELDAALTQISGVDAAKIYDSTAPEGKCRYWMTHGDQHDLRVDQHGESRVQQRFILCLLYHYANGETWASNPWLRADLHECDWHGVTCNATNVAGIELEDKNLTGSLPEALLDLSHLQLLSFLNNNIGGEIPAEIFDRLHKLMWLDLSNNAFTGTIPSGNGKVLEALYVKGNALEGNLPFFPNLQRVLAQRNQLTSMDEKYALEGQFLIYLYAYNNQLSGQLPSTWNTPNLEILDLGFNNLEGPIPQDLWDLPALQSLVVDNNQMTGDLPESAANTALTTVWLDANQLEGTIPSSFGTGWRDLFSLKLQENSLTGAITQDHCSRWPTSSSPSGEWELESDCNLDSMECSCCTQCFPASETRYLRR